MKPLFYTTLLLLALSGCSRERTYGWMQKYLAQEKSRITTTQTSYEFAFDGYSLQYIDSSYETFNEEGQKIGINNLHFFKYDASGKLMAEEYCLRTCENPGKKLYYYDNLNRLLKTTIVTSQEKERVTARYFYNNKNLLIKKTTGPDSLPTTETYAYDSLLRLTSLIKREYNFNVNQWLTHTDSLFYTSGNRPFLKKRRRLGEDLLTISKYRYHDTLLISQTDTTITTLKGYLPTPQTVLHAYFFRTDYTYDLNNRLIEKMTTQPDYKTPSRKVTYKYRKTT